MANPSNVKVDEVLLFPYWGRVKEIVLIEEDRHGRVIKRYDYGECIVVEDLNTGEDFRVTGTALVEGSLSADQYDQTVKLTKTAASDKFASIPVTIPLTVRFVKADGQERTLRGHRLSTTSLGRSQVNDMDVDHTKHRLRQVDHRTIKWFVVEGVKYEVK